jgi:hypothetical protein
MGLGIAADHLHRAAQVAGRGNAQLARARGHHRAADVFRNHRALGRQAVEVAIALVAQRHAVHRVAQLADREAVDEELGVLLIVAPRIGGDVEHAGQRLDRLEGEAPGRIFWISLAGMAVAERVDLAVTTMLAPVSALSAFSAGASSARTPVAAMPEAQAPRNRTRRNALIGDMERSPTWAQPTPGIRRPVGHLDGGAMT